MTCNLHVFLGCSRKGKRCWMEGFCFVFLVLKVRWKFLKPSWKTSKKMAYCNSPKPWLSQLLMDVVIAKMSMLYSFISKLGMINSNYIKCCFRFKWDSNCTEHLIIVSWWILSFDHLILMMIIRLEIRQPWACIWGRVDLSTWSWEIKSSENECCCNFGFDVLKHGVLDVFFQCSLCLNHINCVQIHTCNSISVQFSSVAQSSLTLCNPINRSTPDLPVHHRLPEFTQTHVHRVSDAIQPSHPLSSPSPLAPNPYQHQSLFQWVNSSHEVAKVLEFQL